MKIGIFDSGVGALSVYREVRKAFPKVDIDYFGDTLRMPYGSKTPEEIQKFTLEIGTYLVKEGAEALIIACNTATAYGLNALEKAFPEIPVYGMIEPGARLAVKRTKNKKIGLLATKGTVNSGAYDKALQKQNFDGKLCKVGAGLLAPIVEEGFGDHPGTKKFLETYLKPFTEEDTLILGCTHFPVLEEFIKEILPEVVLINPAFGVVEDIKNKMDNKGKGQTRFKISGDIQNFSAVASKILGEKISAEFVEKVIL